MIHYQTFNHLAASTAIWFFCWNNVFAGIMLDTVWSTEEYLRQTIGTSLSPQNLALKVISERMDTWGNDLVELAPVTLLRQMSSAMESSVRRSSNDESSFLIDKETLSEWILPPAIGFFVVGSAGVGKLTIAHRLAHLLLGHCLDGKASSEQHDNIDGVLEVGMSEQDDDNDNDPIRHEERTHSMKERIVNHIQRREGLGSVAILHHIESTPPMVVSEFSQVLNGKSHSLSFQSLDNELVEANCNGTVFIMTSNVWGTNSIIQHLVQNNGWNVLRSRDSLISSIHQEVNSYVEISSNSASVRIVSCKILLSC